MTATHRNKRVKKELILKVVEAKQRDVGTGWARIDPMVMRRANISPGEIIEIE